MQLDQAVALLTRDHLQVEHSRRPMKVVIPVLSPGKVGGRAFVEVVDLAAGFDWDTGKVFVEPMAPLTLLSPEDVEAIRKSVSLGQSWHAYEAYKKQKAKEDLLTAQRDWLIKEQAIVRDFESPNGTRYYLQWPLEDSSQSEVYPSALEAIDAAMALERPS